jgi:hypothetical protein
MLFQVVLSVIVNDDLCKIIVSVCNHSEACILITHLVSGGFTILGYTWFWIMYEGRNRNSNTAVHAENCKKWAECTVCW